MIYCPKCGKENLNNASYCIYCGEKLQIEIHDEAKLLVKKEELNQYKSLMNFMAIGAGVFFAVGFISIWYNDFIGIAFIGIGILFAIIGFLSSIKYSKILENLKRRKY